MLVTPPEMEQLQIRNTIPKFQDVIVAARPDLSYAESREMEYLFTDYGDIFAIQSDDYGRTDRMYQHIDTGEGRYIPKLPRRFP
jgi:hypothetical protein